MGVLKNSKHERFAQLVAKGEKKLKAYKSCGFSDKSRGNATRLACQEVVRARIDELKVRAAKKAEVFICDILQELKYLAFLDPADAYDKKGELLPIHKMPKRIRRAISGINPDEIQFVNKKASIELLLKSTGHLKTRHEVTGPNGKPIQTSGKIKVTIKDARTFKK